MNRRIISLIVAFLMGFFTVNGYAEEKTKILRIGVQPTTKPIVILERYQPVVDYLKEATGLNMELAISGSYEDFAFLQKSGGLDFVIQDSFSAYLMSRHISLVPIANVISPAGKLYDTGYFVVRADSDINDLNDLKGKKIIFGAKADAAKFLAPYIHLKQSGIDARKDLSYEFGGMCPDNAMAVFLKEFDAGLVCGLYMAQKNKKFNFQTDLRILAITGDWAPYWIVSALSDIDEATTNKVKQALLELNKNNPKTNQVLSICGWKGFAEYSGEINKIGELVKRYAVPN
ncbi:MAG TPA: phosphate/phosphite/phosphonate ABC transporter substrate-binding protein [Anaerolineae bacterium]|nr:phosphate/phosphite/phosphonate ABC transporter substrate-binding protein [Anaerolineae bacterium]